MHGLIHSIERASAPQSTTSNSGSCGTLPCRRPWRLALPAGRSCSAIPGFADSGGSPGDIDDAGDRNTAPSGLPNCRVRNICQPRFA